MAATKKQRTQLQDTKALRYTVVMTGERLAVRQGLRWATAEQFMALLLLAWDRTSAKDKDAIILAVL
jgi:hypothetical protein